MLSHRFDKCLSRSCRSSHGVGNGYVPGMSLCFVTASLASSEGRQRRVESGVRIIRDLLCFGAIWLWRN
ncbi:hypothetical protein TIFTF001_037366 [Ficus carica]|uniref:Uncharacterized protein n=1 Tax=Ficus carica TaxID=3494 RepID=A0AA88E9N4_FICCA|nr:hypothetical protein TIFTF001_037366 [Ficus carica]